MRFFGLGRPDPAKLKATGDIESLVKLLAHRDEQVRAQALDCLVSLSIEPPGHSAERRNLAAAALAALEGSAKEPATQRFRQILMEISPDESAWRNSAVAEALIALGDADAVLTYYFTRASGDQAGGFFLLDVLHLLVVYAASRRDKALLMQILREGRFDYSRDAFGVNSAIQGERRFCFARLRSEMGIPVEKATDVVSEIGSEEDLITLEQHARSRQVRAWSWRTLGKVGSAKCLPAVIEAVETGGLFALDALAAIVPRLSTADLDSLARHPDVRVKNLVLQELCKRSDPSTFGTILSAASSEVEKVSVAAIESLETMRLQEAVPTLTTLLHHSSGTVWRAAARALGTIADPSGLASLLELGADRLVDEVVLTAIVTGGGGPGLLQVLNSQLAQLSAENALRILVALRKCLPPSELASVQDALARPHVESLDAAEWVKRREAIRALGQVGGSLAIQALRARQTTEQDYELSREIARALSEADALAG
jgi:HEAT repeat protein